MTSPSLQSAHIYHMHIDKINLLYKYIVQQREYRQYFIITTNRVKYLKTMSHCCIPENDILKINYGSMLVAQLHPTLCDPMDCSLPSSSVHGILQARILEWVAIPFSRGSSQARDQTWVSCIAGRFLTI